MPDSYMGQVIKRYCRSDLASVCGLPQRDDMPMVHEIEHTIVALVGDILAADVTTQKAPPWLARPGKAECGSRWGLVQAIYADLTDGATLSDAMPPREHRKLDAILTVDGAHRVLEVDEVQHFNRFRVATLRHYADDPAVPLAFPARDWVNQSEQKTRLEAGRFGSPRPPLFPGENGRHRQRAFRDALADILPVGHGWLPTLRIADFQVRSWIFTSGAENRMRKLLLAQIDSDTKCNN